MNIFGLEITFSRNGKTPVTKKECHEAHTKLESFLEVRFIDLNKRVDDLKDSLNNYIHLLKSSK